MQILLPFTRTQFPEMDHLAAEESQLILERCANAPAMGRLSRQHNRAVRLALLIFPLGVAATLFRERLGLPIKVLPWLIWLVLACFVVAFVTSLVVFHLRSSKVLKQLVAEELARLPQRIK
jgi:hypothetical protein